MTRSFSVSGICKDDWMFGGANLRATWTDGAVQVTGVDPKEFRAMAVGRSRGGWRVGIPTGPFYDPADWENPSAFLAFTRDLCGNSLVVEGGEWLPQPPVAPDGGVN